MMTDDQIHIEDGTEKHTHDYVRSYSTRKGVQLKEPELEIDVEADKYPFCLVWTTIPFLSWIFPLLGHIGIADSRGIIYDFSSSYYVNVDEFHRGPPLKYFQLSPSKTSSKPRAPDDDDELSSSDEEEEREVNEYNKLVWNQAIHNAKIDFSNLSYNLLLRNGFHFVAKALNNMGYDGRNNWSVWDVMILMLFKSRFVSRRAIFKTFFPFALVIIVIVLIIVFVIALVAAF